MFCENKERVKREKILKLHEIKNLIPHSQKQNAVCICLKQTTSAVYSGFR